MAQHQIRLTFNNRVNNYEDEIAFIAQLIADKFGDKLDASLPLSKKPSVIKAVSFNGNISFDDAFKLAGDIREFLNSPEAKSKLAVSDISLSTVSLDKQYAKGWGVKFVQLFTFEKN